MAGIPALFGAALMTCMRCLRDERVDACDKQEDQLHVLLNKPAWTEGTILLEKFSTFHGFSHAISLYFAASLRYYDGY